MTSGVAHAALGGSQTKYQVGREWARPGQAQPQTNRDQSAVQRRCADKTRGPGPAGGTVDPGRHLDG